LAKMWSILGRCGPSATEPYPPVSAPSHKSQFPEGMTKRKNNGTSSAKYGLGPSRTGEICIKSGDARMECRCRPSATNLFLTLILL
jgi:hypothetical protein